MSFPPEKSSWRRPPRWLAAALLAVVLAALAVPATGVSHVRAQAQPGGATTPSPFPAAAHAPCFGAASRNPARHCDNASLRLEVVPDPSIARTLPNTPCKLDAGEPDVCEFGVDRARATQTVALVGDSHAGHWRGALQAVALAHGWHGLSVTHTSCPLSKAVRRLPTVARFDACVRWKDEVFAWFQHHPEVHTVFVAGLSGGMGVYPSGGRDEFQTSVAGYLAAWHALPDTVRHIVVIRDTPKVLWTTGACVEQAVAAGQPPGPACAVPRGLRLDPDPLVAAARELDSPRVQVVDLTDVFCDAQRCYPVIGGALVFRDANHMTAVFSRSLGPQLLHAVDGVMASW